MATVHATDLGLPFLFDYKNVFRIVLDFIPHYQLMVWMQFANSPLHHVLLQNMNPKFFLCDYRYCTLGACVFQKNEIQCVPQSILNDMSLVGDTMRKIISNGSDECCVFLLQNHDCFLQKAMLEIVATLGNERVELIIQHSPQSLHKVILTAICNHRLPMYAEKMVHTHGLQRPNMDNVSQWPHEPDMVRYLLETTPCLQMNHQELLLKNISPADDQTKMYAMCLALHESGKLSNEFRLMLFYGMVYCENFDCAMLLYRKEDDLTRYFPSLGKFYFETSHDQDNKNDDDDTYSSQIDLSNWDECIRYFLDDDDDDDLGKLDDDEDYYDDVSFEPERTVLENHFKMRLITTAQQDVFFAYTITAYVTNLPIDDPFAHAVRIQLHRLATLPTNDSVALFEQLCRFGDDEWALFVAQDITKTSCIQTITPESGRFLSNDKLLSNMLDYGRINHENIVPWIYNCLKNQNYKLWCFLDSTKLVPLRRLLQYDKKFIRLLMQCPPAFLTMIWQETAVWEQAYDSLLISALDAKNVRVLRFLFGAPFEVSQTLLATKLPRFIKLGLDGVFAKLQPATLSNDKLIYCYFKALEQPRRVVEALWQQFPIQLSLQDQYAIAHRFKFAICTYKISDADLTDTCIFAVEHNLVNMACLIRLYGMRMLSVLAHFNCDFDFRHTPLHWH